MRGSLPIALRFVHVAFTRPFAQYRSILLFGIDNRDTGEFPGAIVINKLHQRPKTDRAPMSVAPVPGTCLGSPLRQAAKAGPAFKFRYVLENHILDSIDAGNSPARDLDRKRAPKLSLDIRECVGSARRPARSVRT